MNIERMLKSVIKVAAVALTAPATLAVAGGLYPENPIQRVLVQAAGLVLVEGALLLGWHLLDNSKGKADPAQLWLYTGLVVVAFVGLNVIAVAHQEGLAGIVFRATLGVLIVYSIAESGILANIKLSQAADRDVTSHRAVKRHRRNVAIRLAKASIDSEFAVRMAEMQAGQGVTLQKVQRQTERDLAAVRAEHRQTMAAIENLSQSESKPRSGNRFPYPIDRARDKAKQVAKQSQEEVMGRVLDIARDDPHVSLRQLSDRAGVSHETVRRYLETLESDGKIHRNGHGIEVLV